jgi:CHAD domain-containing protein
MATVTTLPSGARHEHRGLSYWMDRVEKELENVRTSPGLDVVHDLRVSIRRCRSVAAVMEEIDPDPAWPEMRKAARKLFHGLGALRDAQVMDEWVKKLGAESDPVRKHLHAEFASSEPKLCEAALRVAGKFDGKLWKRLERHLRQRARLIPAGSLAAECIALERYEEARELHMRALRTEKSKPWHALRIGLKRFRYTVESLLPEHHAAWSENLKRLQDLLGDLHDLDVLAATLKEITFQDSTAIVKQWKETIDRERHERIETYRQLSLGKTSIWNEWRHGLPHGDRLEAASMARLRATARAVDKRPRRTSQVSRIAAALFDALRRIEAGPAFAEPAMRRMLRAAARLHAVGAGIGAKSPQKAARKFLRALTIPPGWTSEQWDCLTWTVRYHRGAEPDAERGAFSKLSGEQQKNIRALAGVLRLARGLRKSGIETGSGLRAEKSQDAFALRVPGLVDTVESAARLAAAKHLLETYLGKPLILKSVTKPEKIVALEPQPEEQLQIATAAASD